MLAEIESRMVKILKENNFDVTSYNFQMIESGRMLKLQRPAALIDSRSGSSDRETIKQTNNKAIINVTLILHNIKKGAEVEFAISKLRDSLISILNHNKLGLDIKNGLLYLSYNNTTSRGGARDLQDVGYHIDEIQFLAEYPIVEITKPEDVSSGDLKSIVIDYFTNNDSTPELEGLIDYTTINGGTPYLGGIDTINGGSTKEDQEDVISGGNP